MKNRDRSKPSKDASEPELPPLHKSSKTSLDEAHRQAARDEAATDPATKFGSWRDGREGYGTRFPEEIDMRPKDRSDQSPTGANATPGSEKHPISPS